MTNWVKEVKECDTSNLFRRLRERVRSDCIERNQDLGGDEFVKFENDATRQFNVVVCKGDGRIQFIHSGKRIGCNSHTDTAGSLPTAYRHDIVESRNLRLVGMCEQGPGSLEVIALHESSEG